MKCHIKEFYSNLWSHLNTTSYGTNLAITLREDLHVYRRTS